MPQTIDNKVNLNKAETKSREYRTFAELFLEEPVLKEQLPGESITYFAKVPIPTFCYFRKIPLIDDCDWLE